MTSYDHATNALLQKLEVVLDLTDSERAAVLALPMQVTTVRADQEIVRRGDSPTRSFVILDGFACTAKTTEDGERQIAAIHIQGDMPDLQSLHLDVLDVTIATVTSCQLGFFQHAAARALCKAEPRLAAALWRETLIYGAIYREWVVNVGIRDAYDRMAHLVCETVARLQNVGLARDLRFEFPLTQAELAEALGITSVHVNRVLQALRASGLLSWNRSEVAINDWVGLKKVARFDPTYLHLGRSKALQLASASS
jgi:CRP-like cAMP-binding protein